MRRSPTQTKMCFKSVSREVTDLYYYSVAPLRGLFERNRSSAQTLHRSVKYAGAEPYFTSNIRDQHTQFVNDTFLHWQPM